MRWSLSPSLFEPNDILFKRIFFSSEQEYRFWFYGDELLQRIEAGWKGVSGRGPVPGAGVGISDVQQLIEKIVVAPGSSDEFIACAEHRMRWLWNLIGRPYSDRIWDSFDR